MNVLQLGTPLEQVAERTSSGDAATLTCARIYETRSLKNLRNVTLYRCDFFDALFFGTLLSLGSGESVRVRNLTRPHSRSRHIKSQSHSIE